MAHLRVGEVGGCPAGDARSNELGCLFEHARHGRDPGHVSDGERLAKFDSVEEHPLGADESAARGDGERFVAGRRGVVIAVVPIVGVREGVIHVCHSGAIPAENDLLVEIRGAPEHPADGGQRAGESHLSGGRGRPRPRVAVVKPRGAGEHQMRVCETSEVPGQAGQIMIECGVVGKHPLHGRHLCDHPIRD